MLEKQPIMKALIEQGYAGSPQLVKFVINEKHKSGVALIKLKSEDQPHNIYWDNSKQLWTEKKPKDMHAINPNVIDRHYDSAI